MKIVCDSCGTKYSISDDKVRGKVFKIRCKKCSHIIVVRGTNDAASSAPAAAEGGWHLVVDGDQVGPLPEADIRARFERGEITGETYVWKEGFSDWLKLSTVPEFGDLAGSKPGEVVAEASAPVAVNGDSSGRQPSGLFGTVGGIVPGGAAPAGEDTSDVFAAPAPAAARAGGGDLFASSTARPAAEESRWPGSGGGGGGGLSAASASHDGGRVENLTGQRHENSVLFSLSNLQSLAMPSAAPKSSNSATTAPTSEGSGLIDIRAMAATTLGAPGGGGPSFGGGSSGDDLPSFGAFSSAAPVLLPLPSSSGPPKWVYPVIGAMVVLVLGIGVMAYKILTAKPPTVVTETVAVPAPAQPSVTPGARPSAPVAAGEPARPSTIADENLPPREAAGTGAPGKVEGKPEGKSSGGHHGSGKGGKKGGAEEGNKEKKGGAGAAVAAAPAAAEPEAKKPAKGSLDDLLQGALSSDRPRQGTQRTNDEGGSRRAAAEAPSAGPLSKGAVVSGMNAVRGKVNECYSQYKVPGMAMVNVVIGKNGKVSTASVTGKFAGTPTGTCVEKAVKSASFPPSDGLSTPYPFQLK